MTSSAAPDVDSEVGALLRALQGQRDRVIETFAGLTDEALRAPMLPSGWTFLGMVQNLSLDVERFWFQYVVAGQDVELCTGDQAWHVPADRSADQVLTD